MEIRDGAGIAAVRARHREGQRVFPLIGTLAVLDPHQAQKVNAATFDGVPMPDRLVDLLRGRGSPTVLWKEVRAGWVAQLAKLGAPSCVAALEDRLAGLVDERLGRPSELPWAIQEVFTQALIPTVLADLSPRELGVIRRDQLSKLQRLMRVEQREDTGSEKLASAFHEVRAGLVTRRVLRGRARDRRPRQLDLADPVVDLLPALGMDRAAFAVTTVLTAIAGPPGAVAVCLLLELCRRPDWAARLAEEIAAIPAERFHESPLRAAPTAYRFVRETLRFWSSPLLLTRVARVRCEVDGHRLEPGHEFNLSPYFLHHDPREWDDPDVFDPDRWLPGSGRGPARACAYAPFGWSPTSCVGAGLGTIELMLLCRLFTTRYRIVPEDLDAVEMVLASVPLPVGFQGTIERR